MQWCTKLRNFNQTITQIRKLARKDGSVGPSFVNNNHLNPLIDKRVYRKGFEKRPATANEDHFDHAYFYRNPEESTRLTKTKDTNFDRQLKREYHPESPLPSFM